MVKVIGVERWVLQWSDKDQEDSAANGAECRWAQWPEECSVEGLVWVIECRTTCKKTLCCSLSWRSEWDWVVLPHVHELLFCCSCRVHTISSPSSLTYFEASSIFKFTMSYLLREKHVLVIIVVKLKLVTNLFFFFQLTNCDLALEF